MCNVWETEQVHTGLWWTDMRETAHRWDDDDNMDLQGVGEPWTGLIWLSIGKSGNFFY